MELLDWKNNSGKDVKIVIIDSGLRQSHPLFQEKIIKGESILYQNGGYIHSSDFEDSIGHGTAVSSIISRMIPDSEIYVIKLFQNELEIEPEALIYTLKYILDELKCDLIHLSLGFTQSDDLSELKDICNKIYDKGIILVSAFDNEGAITFPAAFENVIGVDMSINCKTEFQYEFVESEVINIRAKGAIQRVAWIEPNYIYSGGTSYSAAYVTGYIGKILEVKKLSFQSILNQLKNGATNIHTKNYTDSISKPLVTSAVVFPFNKEVENMLRYSDLLSFELKDVYDSKYSGNIGRCISNFFNTTNSYSIKSINDLDWETDFDTFILGHTNLLNKNSGINYKEEIIEKCIKHGKNLYSFDDFSDIENAARLKNAHFPLADSTHLPQNRFGKLRRIGKPVIGVFGTSSSQGKFSLQLSLRKLFISNGYRVGQLGTEPSSLLYGFDEVYPMGYSSNVKVQSFNAIQLVNEMMARIEDNSPEIIIVGSQSGTIPYETSNISLMTCPQLEFLMGTLPDVYLLCINIDDDIDYIGRTINVLENLTRGKVTALVIFPFQKSYSPWRGKKLTPVNVDLVEKQKLLLTEYFKIATYTLTDIEDQQKIFNSIIECF